MVQNNQQADHKKEGEGLDDGFIPDDAQPLCSNVLLLVNPRNITAAFVTQMKLLIPSHHISALLISGSTTVSS
jgi:hypothetical protein